MRMPFSANDPSRPHVTTPSVVGRDRELRLLRDRLELTLSGQGSLVLVSGEAGIGKTTLVGAVAREAARSGALVLSGACYDLATARPYGPWLEALGRYPREPDLPPVPDLLQSRGQSATAGSQESFFEHVSRFLASIAAQRPLVLLLEDLHWADSASLDLLRYAGRAAADLALLLLLTYRDDSSIRDTPLYATIPHLVRENNPGRIALGRLALHDVRNLVRERYPLSGRDEDRLASYLHDRAGGNPFFTLELLHELERSAVLARVDDGWRLDDLQHVPVPLIVRQMIEARFELLDPESRALLELAAVIGHEVPVDLWHKASTAPDGQVVRAIEQAVAAHLIAEMPNGSHVRFTHGLVSETLYLGQAASSRALQHVAIAGELASQPEPAPEIVSHHFERAGDPRAIEWLIRAGERAYVLYAARDAIAYLNRASGLADRLALQFPLSAYRLRALAHEMAGEFGRARADHSTVLERARMAGDRRAEWQALLDLSALWTARDYQRAGGYCRAALELAREIDDATLIAHSLNQVANWHVNRDEPDVALPLHEEALAIFEERGDREGIAETLDLMGLASYIFCDFESSLRYAERAVTLLRDLDDRQRLSSSLATLSQLGGSLDCDVAMPVYRESAFWRLAAEEGLAIARSIGWLAGEAYALLMESLRAGALGELGHAWHSAEMALNIAERIGHGEWTIASHYTLGAIAIELQDPDRSESELEQALSSARVAGARFWISHCAARLALLRVSMGDLERASATLQTVIQPAKPLRSMGQRQCRLVLAELERARRNPARALAIVDDLTGGAPPVPSIDSPYLMKLRGDVLVDLDRLDDAERSYDAARASAGLLGFRPLLWRIDAARGALARVRGRVAEADAAFGEAHATIDEIAGEISDETVRERFRSRAVDWLLADRSDDALPEPVARLSPRELDVLALLIEGKSDREIAEALFLSPRTVMRHVTGILNKLGVHSRTAAVSIAIRKNLI
jgi:DNA-binding CsgD family transcriptional regulator